MFGKWGYVSFIKVVKLLSQLMENYQVHILRKLVSIKVCFEYIFIDNSSRCSDRRCEGWLINEAVICRRSCFVWGITK